MTATANVQSAPVFRPTVAVWFEIPADSFSRATAFYEGLFATALTRVVHGETNMAVFPYERPGISGCVADRKGESGALGPVIFLNADGQLDAMLDRIYDLGGRIVQGRTAIGDGMGWFAIVIDTEGNRIGLHTIS